MARLLEHSPKPESTYHPTWAVVFGKAEKMQDSEQRKDNADSSKQIAGLPVVRHKVAGIDLGSERHWVCAPTGEGSGRDVADFGATTCELIRMAKWLNARKIESVAMESRQSRSGWKR